MNIETLWKKLNDGETVFWCHSGYKVYAEKCNESLDYQLNHFSFKDGKILSVRCIDNYFGGLINESDLGNLFT